ncbi:hypothetical protein HMPREF2996_02400 [Corynebacterium sp. HMSC066C02]|nr:hypothetical protein HMPREF2996_02400 [Corynebacterium sp. HMSC066C02]
MSVACPAADGVGGCGDAACSELAGGVFCAVSWFGLVGDGCGLWWVASPVDDANLVGEFVVEVCGPFEFAGGLCVEGQQSAESWGCGVGVADAYADVCEGVERYFAQALFLVDVGCDVQPVTWGLRAW